MEVLGKTSPLPTAVWLYIFSSLRSFVKICSYNIKKYWWKYCVEINEIFVYKYNFYVFTREEELINKINMSFAHE